MEPASHAQYLEKLIPPVDETRVWEWNSSVPAPHRRCIHQIFEDTARRHLSATAVCSWDKTFTYDSLDQLSSKLASCLLRLGVGQEAPVILCFDKSAWAVVAALGVLKSGGAFVPVSAGKADERTLSILQQTKSHLVLTQESYVESYTELVHKAIAVDDRLFESIPGPKPSDYCVIPSVHQTAYIIFTSGSTGSPKGVVVEHEAASTSILSQAESFRFGPETRQLQFSSYVFDMSITETFATLLHGGCLCIPSETQRLEDLAGVISAMKVNAAILTPTMARRLDPSQVTTLQSLCMGAEMITESDLSQWKHLPRLAQGYGPTECAAVTHTNTATDIASHPHTIGRATGCVGWIIDPENDQRLMPIGQVGELAIEGHILARGYLGDPVKTDAAFIRDPVWLLHGTPTHPGRHGRVYKTGDLVYYNPDGTCEIVGRKDTQVKIRGQRVELGDVENSLRRVFPEADAIAAELITPAGADGPPQLAAFLSRQSVVESEVRNSIRPLEITTEQRRLLGSSVRDVLRPAFFFAVKAMPTTSSGKLDRKRLREIASLRPTEELLSFPRIASKESRLTEMTTLRGEDLIRKLWSHCLHIDEELIHADSDFFSLGGSSISVIELIAEARKHGLHWKMSDIFENPVLAQQASAAYPAPVSISQTPDTIAPFALLPMGLRLPTLFRTFRSTYGLRAQDIEDIYPCTPAQEHLMSVTAYRTHAFTLQLGMRINHSLDVDQVQLAVAQVVSALPLLRTRLVKLPMGPTLQVVMKESIEWQYGTSLTEYLAKDSERNIDFGSPLARFGLVHDLNEEWLILTLHHALWDRWSLPLILKMLGQAYHGQALPQAPLVKDFIKEATSMDRKASHDFWDSYLEHPTWKIFPKVPSGITVPRASEIMRRGFSKPTILIPGITLSVILRATWAILHSRGSGSNDVLFGTTVFGRNCTLRSVEAVVGPTIATVPVRIQVPQDATVKEYLNIVQKGVLDSAEHEHAWLKKFSEQSARKQSDVELNTLFVVQPREHQRLVNPFNEGDEALWLLGAFDDHVLLVQCEIFSNRVVVTANFDPRTVRRSDVQEALDSFETVCKELASGIDQGKVDNIGRNVKPWQPSRPDPKESWRWLWCCIVIYGTSFLYGLDFTIVACMQDSIVATFGSAANLTWIGSGFPLGSLILILPVGYIFGLFENRNLYAGAIIVFLVGSVLSGAAPNMAAIIAGRIIAGAGGGGMYLGALNCIGSLTKRRERTVYAAFTGFFYGIGVILGPIIGGAIASSSITWRWGFYTIAIVAGLLALSTAILPAMEPRPGVNASNKLKRMDWLGTVIFATVTVVWSVLFSGGGSTWSWLDARTWVLLAILVLGLICFVVQQYFNILTSETWKIFPTEFLRSRALVALFIATAASASALYVTTYYTPLIFQFARGDTPISASIRIIPLMALFIVAVVVQGIFMPRLGPYMPWYIVGGVFILVGGALMCTVTATTSAAVIQGYTVLIGSGGGLCLQAAYAITTAKVKGEKLSSAISFINVAQIGAGVLSLTIAGAIYQNLGTQKLQALLPSHALGSDNIRDALAGLSSGALLDGNGLTRDDVATAITDTISNVFILVAAAGAVVVLSGFAMPVERLFYKKQSKGSRSAIFSRHTSKVPVSAV
ncbi:hypothetical protein V502_02926 [Pseudogymnoascus sp. VKM F-4520 (FW-2644)]|nr:hypothetical protein V502_02926 [Pseudogymnoascus sp. VKM F-4520 (FW-2644)]